PKTRGATTALSPTLVAALQQRIEGGEQSLVFLNRRGYAPVLHCTDCGWKSGCPHCSAWRVFHKLDRTLRCHHCGLTDRVPRACPDCGNLDIAPLGRGTERLEEQLAQVLTGADGARAGRAAARAGLSEMWLQTCPPRHPLYGALRRHAYEQFAQSQLAERETAGLPPYSHLAMLRADARSADAARDFLQAAAALAER